MLHAYHGVNRNGNAGTLLYVHGNPEGMYRDGEDCVTIADLTEKFIWAEISFDEAPDIVRSKQIVYAPDATMQAMLSDRRGQVFVQQRQSHTAISANLPFSHFLGEWGLRVENIAAAYFQYSIGEGEEVGVSV